jgi:hypothetical protein
VEIASRVVRLPVDVTPQTVKLSAADYAMPGVKILVPALADATVLNHRNSGEGAPCRAVADPVTVDQIIQNRPGKNVLTARISIRKQVTPDPQSPRSLLSGPCRLRVTSPARRRRSGERRSWRRTPR